MTFVWTDHSDRTTVATTQQVDQLNRDGYFVLEKAFHRDTLTDVSRALALESGTPTGPGAYSSEPPADVLRRFCRHPLLAGLARDFVGADARIGADAPVPLPPRDTDRRPFHQDTSPTTRRPAQFLSCWINVAATPGGRCVQIARGHHRRGLLRFDLTDPDPDAGIDAADVIDIAAPAGSVVVMSSLTPRRIHPNPSDHAGLLYAVQYVHDVIELDATDADGSRRRFPVVRGGQLVGPV